MHTFGHTHVSCFNKQSLWSIYFPTGCGSQTCWYTTDSHSPSPPCLASRFEIGIGILHQKFCHLLLNLNSKILWRVHTMKVSGVLNTTLPLLRWILWSSWGPLMCLHFNFCYEAPLKVQWMACTVNASVGLLKQEEGRGKEMPNFIWLFNEWRRGGQQPQHDNSNDGDHS